MDRSLTSALIFILFVLSLDATARGNKEERRRAASAYALRHRGLPSALFRLITSNGHETRNCGRLEMGFFPENEWKRLKRVFRHNNSTKAIRYVIDRYDDACVAWRESPDITDNVKVGRSVFRPGFPEQEFAIVIWHNDGASWMRIALNADYQIIKICLIELDDTDIDDLSNLPPNLIEFSIRKGTLGNLEFNKLPKGLKSLFLHHTDVDTMLQIRCLPSMLEALKVMATNRKAVVLHLPVPQRLTVRVTRLNVLVFDPEPTDINITAVDPDTGRTTSEAKWKDGSRIRIMHR